MCELRVCSSGLESETGVWVIIFVPYCMSWKAEIKSYLIHETEYHILMVQTRGKKEVSVNYRNTYKDIYEYEGNAYLRKQRCELWSC